MTFTLDGAEVTVRRVTIRRVVVVVRLTVRVVLVVARVLAGTWAA